MKIVFLMLKDVDDIEIKYIKKCTESFRRFKFDTQLRYMRAQEIKFSVYDRKGVKFDANALDSVYTYSEVEIEICELYSHNRERYNAAKIKNEKKKQAQTWQLYDDNTKLDNGLYYTFIYVKKDKVIVNDADEIEIGGYYTLKLIENVTDALNRTFNINYFDYMNRVSDCMRKSDFILDEQFRYKIIMYKKIA